MTSGRARHGPGPGDDDGDAGRPGDAAAAGPPGDAEASFETSDAANDALAPSGPGAPTPSSPPAGTVPGDLADPATVPSVPATGRIGSPERAGRPSIGWTELVVAAVVYALLQFVLGAVAFVLNGLALPSAPWLAGLSALSAFVAVGVALSLRVRSRLAVGLRRVRVRVVLAGIGIGLGVWVLSRVLILVYVGITGDASDPQQDLTTFSGPVAATVTVLIAGLVVPFGEELLFRGIGYASLRRYGTAVATLVSAAAFGLAHGLNVVLAAAVVLGVANAMLYERTRSIWPSVAAHATFNLISFGLLVAVG